MTEHPFDPAFEDLPAELPIFPLAGALLLPGGSLPLNIFEPRYLAMVDHALANARMIGMVLPRDPDADGDVGRAETFGVGCAGRIVSFGETEDGRYMITLRGVNRFRIAEELEPREGFRRVRAEFGDFQTDREAWHGATNIDRKRLLRALGDYLKARELSADWDAVEQAPLASLVLSLAMTCPFKTSEKQALLETADLSACSATLIQILELAILEDEDEDKVVRLQ